ncbi:MAG: transcriptional regulator [Candidatus Hydrogenedentota bacterium]|nr:MAG: transcriptional regulator [Candidatus Hydrogenedentota bacterium]GIX43626.1 MAG: hypothetical protein KatS3mg130_0034 [Candidatus Sumerlaea sp.]
MVRSSKQSAHSHAAVPFRVAAVLEEVLGCKWSLQILSLLAMGPHRPSKIQKHCAGLSAKVMNERLKKLTHYGLVERQVYGDKPPLRVEYRLSEFGKKFATILDALQALERELAGAPDCACESEPSGSNLA